MAVVFDDITKYLNQGLPSIDPIFGNTGTSATTTTPAISQTAPAQGLTPEQLLLLMQQQNQGGGGGNDGYTGFGDFGNLIEDSMKMQEIAVMNEDGEWELQTVPTYQHATSGLYQTLQGKNVNHMGLYPPTLAGILSGQFLGKPGEGSIASINKFKQLKPIIEDYYSSQKHGLGDGSVMEKAIQKAKQKKHADIQRQITLARHGDSSVKNYSTPDRGDKSGATGTDKGGFTNPGRGSYGPHMAQGGVVGLWRN
tara:strand:+ start:753 stop:1511 length:759 start_codon:yes stop_codon:yes gene_type:complete